MDDHLTIVDGDDPSDGSPVRTHTCGKMGYNIFRSSGSSLSFVFKTGKRRNPKGFGGFRVRCRIIKWGAWFGAADDGRGLVNFDYGSDDGQMRSLDFDDGSSESSSAPFEGSFGEQMTPAESQRMLDLNPGF